MTRLAEQIGKSHRGACAAILGIGTSTPPALEQELAASLAAQRVCRTPEQEAWLARVFLRCGIQARGTVLARGGIDRIREFYPAYRNELDRGPTTRARMEQYAAEAPPLALQACAAALAQAQTPADAITHLITVSCTGFFAPGLDTEMIRGLGLSPGVRRLHVGFMGCHAAFNALAAARDAARADDDARVLVCCVELSSLHFAYGWDPGKLVANALFADGAAAVVLGHDAGQDGSATWSLRDTSSLLVPGTTDAMTWRIGDHGFEMTLSPELPEMIRKNLRGWCDGWLAEHDLRIGDIASWAVHPGGPRILGAVADALGVPAEAMRTSRAILSRHGNMSSATILFILEQMAADGAAGPCVAIGLGPGLMVEGMLLGR